MNPTGAFWWELFGRLMLESSALIALAGIVGRKIPAPQRRKVWQVALTALLLLFIAEGTGLHQRMAFLSAQPNRAPISRRLTIEVLPVRNSTPPAAVQPRSEQRPSIAGWVPGIIWLAISGSLLVRFLGSRLLFVALKGRRRSLNDPDLRQKVEALARPMNLRARIHLSESAHLVGPIAFGFLRRCICVPQNFARTFAAREQEVMLAHELAHLAVRDPLWYAIVDVAAALFWFNPLAWFGRRQFQAACESAADEASLLVPDGPPALAECLVGMGKRLAGMNSYGWIGIEGTRFRSALSRRVNRLLTLEATPWRPLSARWIAAVYCAAAIVLFALLAAGVSFARDRTPSLIERLWHINLAQVPPPNSSVGWVKINIVDDTTNGDARKSTVYTRFFRISKLEEAIGVLMARRGLAAESSLDNLKLVLEEAGIDLSPPTEVFHNSRKGMLMVHAGLHELEAIEKLIEALIASPPQLTIEAKFVEFDDVMDAVNVRNLTMGGDADSFEGILTPSRYRDLMKRLEAQKGVNVLAAPRVTTLSGRQAQIKIVDVKHIVTDLDGSERETKAPKPFEFGPVMDVIPTARADGLSIDITLITRIRELVGYDLEPPYVDSGPAKPLTPVPLREYAGERNVNASDPIRPALAQVRPRPTFRLRQAQTRACVWDGQTVVLYLRPGKDPAANPNIKYTPSGKMCFLFVTPVLIDPAGNRVNNENVMPFVEQTVPK